jgi:hypothetical protein
MIVWRGYGILVVVIIFVSSLGANFLALTFGGNGYWETHSWPFAVAMAVAGAGIWLVDWVLSRQPGRTLIDVATNERVVLANARDFFFVPMKWWAPIVAGTGVAIALSGWVPG